MDRNAIIKWLLLFGLIAFSIYAVYPPEKQIRLGLDIKGGVSFALQIDEAKLRSQIRSKAVTELTDEQVEAEIKKTHDTNEERTLLVLRNRIDNMGIAEPEIYSEKGATEEGKPVRRFIVKLPGITTNKQEEAKETILSVAFLEFRIVHKKNSELVAELFTKGVAPEGYKLVSLGRESYFVMDPAFPKESITSEYKERLGRFNVPDAEYEFLLEKDEAQNQTVYKPYFVKRRAELSGDCLDSASVDYGKMLEPVVNLSFDSKGAKVFGKVTSDYAPGGEKNPSMDKQRQLAIVLDGTLYSAPSIREPILGGKAEISGRFTEQDARRLANVLSAGSLPAPLEIVESRSVDPSLGADAVKSGTTAAIYACVAVFVLMALYYLTCGVIADIALVLNLVLLPLGMWLIAGIFAVFAGTGSVSKIVLPVLTLPGIAGIALTIGMAVDANVLIFERMREEMQTGKGYLAVVQAGFDRAFSAIFDSNITTIITAVILFILGGAGPVRGYAVTLTAGLIVSLFTAVVVSRMCFDLIGSKTQNMKVLKMFSLFKSTTIDWIGIWKIPLSISILLIVVSWGVMIAHGMKDKSSVFGVDFTGGSAITLSYKQKIEVESIRKSLNAGGIGDVTIQYQSETKASGGNEYLQLKLGGIKEGATASKVLAEKFPEAGFTLLKTDAVGPQIGKEMMTKALWALIWSLVAMIIYLWFRFELGFGIGATVAVFHDVLVTAGVCHLLGLQMSMTVMAALLTIIGYSVNDTIVIFDRIRENLRLVRNRPFIDICNLSVNQTLARTILTNLLTFISVLCLVVFGGGSIKDFSLTMFIGMIAGTYSTMYIATPVVLMWYHYKTPDLGSKTVVK